MAIVTQLRADTTAYTSAARRLAFHPCLKTLPHEHSWTLNNMALKISGKNVDIGQALRSRIDQTIADAVQKAVEDT